MPSISFLFICYIIWIYFFCYSSFSYGISSTIYKIKFTFLKCYFCIIKHIFCFSRISCSSWFSGMIQSTICEDFFQVLSYGKPADEHIEISIYTFYEKAQQYFTNIIL